jgi:hypothetical protein
MDFSKTASYMRLALHGCFSWILWQLSCCSDQLDNGGIVVLFPAMKNIFFSRKLPDRFWDLNSPIPGVPGGYYFWGTAAEALCWPHPHLVLRLRMCGALLLRNLQYSYLHRASCTR